VLTWEETEVTAATRVGNCFSLVTMRRVSETSAFKAKGRLSWELSGNSISPATTEFYVDLQRRYETVRARRP